ncbi:MAG: ATP-binding protein, partial [Patescibacteria group bacterium]
MPKKASKNSPKNAGGKGGGVAATANGSNGYTAKDIYVLEGLEPVRKRPGMYIGSTGVEGLHHLIWEVVDNSIDEALAGFAKNISLTFLPDNVVRVVDDGRGIPVDIHKQTKKSALETVMTTLHAGGKFGGDSYKVSGGLHGVGVSVVNALSKKLVAEVCRDGRKWRQEYARGAPTSKVKEIGKCQGSGTAVTFEPDPAIFKEIRFEWNTVLNHLRQQAYLTAGVNIQIRDEREKEEYLHKSYAFCFESGIRSYVEYLNRGQKAKHESVFYVAKEASSINVEVALQYIDELSVREEAFANNIYNPEGGAHITGFRTALTRVLNDYARKNGYLKEKDSLTGEDVREGLTAVISVKLREPQFEGQTKAKLGTPEARGAVESVFGEAFSSFLEENPQEARAILEKVILALEARKAAKAAKETVLRRGALEGLTLPGKLADCQSRKAEDSELFLVEGDSAGGCFSGDTKVALADGRDLSFADLVEEAKAGKKNYCYTIQESGSVGIGKITNPRLTKKNAEVIKITLDSGEEITVTPDHLFMLRDGSYKKAAALTSTDSLMPLYRQYSKIGKRITIEGYEMVFDSKETRWIFTHMLSDAYNLAQGAYSVSQGPHRHHKDFNKLNNNPDNLTRLTRERHLEIHRMLVEKTLRRPDVIEKVKAFHRLPSFRAKMSKVMSAPAMRKVLSERAKKQWDNPQYKASMAEQFLNFYNTNKEYREKTLAV